MDMIFNEFDKYFMSKCVNINTKVKDYYSSILRY